MKLSPQCYGVVGELSPVTPDSGGVVKMVSASVSAEAKVQ